jgi:thioredoxin 1
MNSNDTEAMLVEIAETNFRAEVLQFKQPVLVEFCVPGSRSCQILDSVLKEIAAEWEGATNMVKINAESKPDLSRVLSDLPTVYYFVKGRVRSRIVGAASKETILAKITTADEE